MTAEWDRLQADPTCQDIDVKKLSNAELYAIAYPLDPDGSRWAALAEILLRINRKLDAIMEKLEA
jgi:hypothetical protein